jgi:hypothetical protein
MPKIMISDAAWRAMRDKAIGGLHGQGEQQPDGRWLIEVEAPTLARMYRIRKKTGETIDQLLIRMAAMLVDRNKAAATNPTVGSDGNHRSTTLH